VEPSAGKEDETDASYCGKTQQQFVSNSAQAVQTEKSSKQSKREKKKHHPLGRCHAPSLNVFGWKEAM
jgi:hypothetical protein